jgi:hypothetical protein
METHRIVICRGSHTFYTIESQQWGWQLSSGADYHLPTRMISDNHFCHKLSQPHGYSADEMIRTIKKNSNDLVRNQSRNLLVYGSVPQPTKDNLLIKYQGNRYFCNVEMNKNII